jgi:hypothetical protein
MLATLTALSGSYCLANAAFVLKNKQLLQNNMLKTWNGNYHYFKKANITNNGVMYKVYRRDTQYTPPVYVGDKVKIPIGGSIEKVYTCISYGNTFTMLNQPKLATEQDNFMLDYDKEEYFKDTKGYNEFCNLHNIVVGQKNLQHNKVLIKYSEITKNSNVYMLVTENNECIAMTNFNEQILKDEMQYNAIFRLPLSMTNCVLFCVLVVMCFGVYC